MKKHSIRFKITINAGRAPYAVASDPGRVFYVYAASQQKALDTFKNGYPGEVSSIDVEEDKADWKTTLQEGPTASGRVVAAL